MRKSKEKSITVVDERTHNERILDQFTRQAATFGERHTQDESLLLMVRASDAALDDTVLDIGCGPGIVACAFAKVAGHVTGLDLTPAMLERAQARQNELSLTNLTWQCGDVAALPFPDNSFSIVVTRFTFHHFLSPEAVLAEMVRVCRPGGRILVSDATPEAAKLEDYDRFETLRDPSHAHALSPEDLRGLFTRANLLQIESMVHELEMDFELLLSGSFPNPGDAERVRQWIHDDLNENRIGLGVHLKGDRYFVSFPMTIVTANKAAQEGKP
jgi:ubiquinone/menaquinone biosynthesis C-methylase UbiE